jgi:hypothetical protein
MPPFTYPQPQTNPYAASIAELMLRGGDIKANEAVALGNIEANAATGIAGDVAKIPQQIQQQKVQQLQTQDLSLDVDTKKRAVALQKQLSDTITNTPQVDENGLKLYDVPTITKGLAASGFGDSAMQVGKNLSDMNDSFRAVQASKLSAASTAAAKLISIGAPADLVDHSVDQFKANGIIDAATADQLHALIKADPANAMKVAQYFAPPAKIGEAAPGSMGRNLDTGAIIPGSQVPDKPIVLGPQDTAVQPGAGGAPPTVVATNPNQRQPEAPQAGSEGEAVTIARRIATQANGGRPLSDSQLQIVDAKAMQDYKTQNADPDLRAAALAQRNIAGLLAQMQLNNQPTKEQASSVADDLVNHRIAPEQLASLFSTRGAAGMAFKLQVASEAKKIDPTFNFEAASAEYQLAKSPGFQNTVRYMDSTMESMPQLLKNAQALNNVSVRSVNKLINAGKNEFNNVDLKKFKTDVTFVGDEIAKILAGGGTGNVTSDAKLKQGQDVFSTSDDPQAIAAALGEVQSLMGNRRRALTRGTYMEGSSASTGTMRVKGPNGQTGTVPAGTTLPDGWSKE